MKRLQNIEKHLQDRKQAAAWDPFEKFGAKTSFAVLYFQRSPEHQQLYETIMERAEAQRTAKLEEYRNMRHELKSVDDELSGSNHTKKWNSSSYRYDCVRGCNHCHLLGVRKGLTITRYEWPLPSNAREARAVVFEIAVPKVVKVWRDLTIKILVDIFGDATSASPPGERAWYAKEYGGLVGDVRTTSRLHPASTTKPFMVSHYRSQHVSEFTESSICVNHGSKYSYYDLKNVVGVDNGLGPSSVPLHCSHADGVGGILANRIRTAQHTPNEVIAAQSQCAADMSLDEFKAFGTLRVGVRIQWANVLGQLLIPSIDLKKRVTCLLILQACHEAGPKDDGDSARITPPA